MENNDNNMDQEATTKKGTKIGVITGVTAVAIIGLAFLGVYLFSALMSDDKTETTIESSCVPEIKNAPTVIQNLVPAEKLNCDKQGNVIAGDQSVSITKKFKPTNQGEVLNELRSFLRSVNVSEEDYKSATDTTALYSIYPWLDSSGTALSEFEKELTKRLEAMPSEEAFVIVSNSTTQNEYLKEISSELNKDKPVSTNGDKNSNSGIPNTNLTNIGDPPLFGLCARCGGGIGHTCLIGGCLEIEIQFEEFPSFGIESYSWNWTWHF